MLEGKILWIGKILLFLSFLYLIRMVLIPFLLGFLLSYMLHPLVLRLKKRGLSCTLAILVIYGWLLLIMGACAFYFFPLLVEELEDLALSLPRYFQQLQEFLQFIDGEYRRINLPSPLQQLLDEGLYRIEEISIQLVERITTSLITFLSRLFFIILTPVISFYLLRDLEGLKEWWFNLIPRDWQASLLPLLERLDGLIFSFFRGQILLSFLIALMSTMVYLLLQIKSALVLGLFTGMMNIIPYLGPVLGALPPVLFLFIQDPSRIPWLILIMVLIQQVETAYLAPRIMNQELGLHPLSILFSLLVGGELLGIPGMMLSIPGAALMRTLYLHFFLDP